MNFTKEASLELYIKAMKTLGLPEEEIAKSYLAEEVANFIGEMVNQIIGNFRRKIEKKYGLIGKNNQPKAIVISRTIIMYVDTFLQASQNRKISFRTEEGSQFYAELSLEQTEFIPLKSAEGEAEEPSVEDLLKEFF